MREEGVKSDCPIWSTAKQSLCDQKRTCHREHSSLQWQRETPRTGKSIQQIHLNTNVHHRPSIFSTTITSLLSFPPTVQPTNITPPAPTDQRTTSTKNNSTTTTLQKNLPQKPPTPPPYHVPHLQTLLHHHPQPQHHHPHLA